MRDGLGLRFAFMGPMETIHLNALGLKKYCETYGETISNVSKTMGDIPSAWLMETEEDKAKVLKIQGSIYDHYCNEISNRCLILKARILDCHTCRSDFDDKYRMRKIDLVN